MSYPTAFWIVRIWCEYDEWYETPAVIIVYTEDDALEEQERAMERPEVVHCTVEGPGLR